MESLFGLDLEGFNTAHLSLTACFLAFTIGFSCYCSRMDCSSACRIALHVSDYVEFRDDGRQLTHGTRNFELVVDRDTTNFKDLSDDVAVEVKHGTNQGMNLTFWNKEISAYSTLTSDSTLMAALDMYWEYRRLPLTVMIYDTIPLENSHQQASQSTDIVAESGSIEAKAKKAKKSIDDDDEPWVDDEEEYVGINDELPYMSDVEANKKSDYAESDSDSSGTDELLINDEAGCDVLEHVTNLENPTIALNMTFEDGDTFKRAIRQYAVLNEFEIAAPYSEKTRYRGYCKGKQSKGKSCKWRIHASELQDEQTWQVGISMLLLI